MTSKPYFVPHGIGPLQVDFPIGCKQERKGAVHFRPGSTVYLTDDELAHLKRHHTVLAAQLRSAEPKSAVVPKPRARVVEEKKDEVKSATESAPRDTRRSSRRASEREE